ncbi:cytochrome c [Chelatococcus sp. SYSU_G07232]|uniref:Cytochrome c n=1 Tax=Chelatococcus albus TaxID=3047466 RepID=A0ABT7AGL7_9HYPH|nr:cytochrome c [Chelatococcus sp. SYSU_G07232]MDJ1158511.1 cytochrome c [Chelatococcus sp. SYSU_G07232]
MKRFMGAIALVALFGAGGAWVLTSPSLQATGTEALPGGASNLENGRTLFYAGGCTSCHAVPGAEDKTRLGGGLALHSPFGTFYAPNISPHPRDGIGAWTPEQFVRAMRAGVSPDGRHYYPAFPYTSYQRMNAGDLRDLFAFMMTLPAVEGRVRDHDLPFPFNIRRALGFWKLIYLDGKVFEPAAGKSAAANRGAYLVEGPGHCAECHSPRDRLGGIVSEQRFAGGPNPDGKGVVPNITPDASGIGSWSKSDIVELLTTGFTPEFDSVGSNMAPVVKNTANLPQSDREAMADYLKSLPARPSAVKKAPK